MAHWRDGGIGNMPDSDDRPIEEWTLLEKLAAITQCGIMAGTIEEIAQAAFDEIQRLRDHDWLPIGTAPVEPGHTVPGYYRFRCLLQDERDHVFEGAGYYVKLGRSTPHMALRWQNGKERQVFPKFWKPLPMPKKAENGGAA